MEQKNLDVNATHS